MTIKSILFCGKLELKINENIITLKSKDTMKINKEEMISKRQLIISLLLILLISMFFISFLLGIYHLHPFEVIITIYFKLIGASHNISPVTDTIVFKIRLPRIIGSILVGSSLSIAEHFFKDCLEIH